MRDNGTAITDGCHRQAYIPTLRSGNPEKKPKSDWWDEICKAYGEKNYFPPKGKEQVKNTVGGL